MKKVIALLLTAMLVLTCFASVLAEDMVTVKINVLDTDKQNNDERYTLLREKFNIDFELIACSLNDVKEKARIWVAGGDIPDVLWTDFGTAQFGELREWIDSGSFRPIPDLSAYPNLEKVQGLIQSDDTLITDGERYFLMIPRDSYQANFSSYERFVYRKDWAQKLGLYHEDNVYTWEEMLAMAKAFVEQDPGENGDGKTIGLVGVGWSFPAMAGLQQQSPYWNSYAKLEDGSYVWGGNLPETIEGVKMVKRMHDEGIVWEDHALAQTLDGPSKFQAGQAGILYHNLMPNNLTNVVNNLCAANPGKAAEDMLAVMKVKSPDGSYYVKQTEEYYGTLSFRYDVSDEVVARVLSMLDYLASEEGRRLLINGVEGKDYQIEADGTITCLWEKDETGKALSPYAINSDRLLSWAMLGEYDLYFSPATAAPVRAIGQQILEFAKDPNGKIAYYDADLAAFSAPNKDKYDIATETRNKILELIVSSENIEADYIAWTEEVAPKVQLVLDELNAGLAGK